MSKSTSLIDRRAFLRGSGQILAGTALVSSSAGAMAEKASRKMRVALVGTGIRGIRFWGRDLVQGFSDAVEFVGLCDTNPGRLQFAQDYIGVDCPTFTDIDALLDSGPIDMVMVTTDDASHDEIIVKALDRNINVITEKPMTTDEHKCAAIQKAVERSDAELIMSFNYRYGHMFTSLKEVLDRKEIGDVVSVDFNWYLNTYHGASYFRRWHGLREKGGTLLLHKSAHHFDLLNWFIESDPVEVSAYGALEHYGHNNDFRGKNCRECPHQKKCDYYWDITKDELATKLYVENEHHDGYIRDNCLWREEIDIFDKMSVQVRYANNVIVNYSLTTYSPFEGFRLALNGKHGRVETWEGIPWLEEQETDQSKVYEKEMGLTSHSTREEGRHELIIAKNFGDYQRIELPYIRKAHWGGDPILNAHVFKGIPPERNFGQKANFRDGAMSVLIGVAARKSIDEGRPVKIEELTDLKPQVKRMKA
ncbi:oxidoreductase family protein [Marinimicrobium koreense]|uniref:Oxidoreductase family protein n=1 Tax=Marinimicrobium koreense TaxID=306545 RepID=A0A3N1NXS1_9GAMM|nr:Gfo/Idh/MocA family oxidoreductase [Marinimicrobium koreense]ROQ20973.1 oxidoreductase family protein [Marinimicrobium koreense]